MVFIWQRHKTSVTLISSNPVLSKSKRIAMASWAGEEGRVNFSSAGEGSLGLGPNIPRERNSCVHSINITNDLSMSAADAARPSPLPPFSAPLHCLAPNYCIEPALRCGAVTIVLARDVGQLATVEL